MTLCRKCGKEIPDGEELCEDCKNKESQMDEAYLEELMQNMSDEEKEPENAGEPAPVMDEQVEEKPAEEASDGVLFPACGYQGSGYCVGGCSRRCFRHRGYRSGGSLLQRYHTSGDGRSACTG